MTSKFGIGDPVRVRRPYPFAGRVGQICSTIEPGVFGVKLEPAYAGEEVTEVRFVERELEAVTEAS